MLDFQNVEVIRDQNTQKPVCELSGNTRTVLFETFPVNISSSRLTNLVRLPAAAAAAA